MVLGSPSFLSKRTDALLGLQSHMGSESTISGFLKDLMV